MKRNVSQILIVSFISLCFVIMASSSVYALSPFGQILINSDSPATNSTAVTLTLNAADPALGCIQAFPSICGVSEMSFSNDGTSWSTPEPAAIAKDWTLLPGDGNKTVYVQFRDEVGNWSGIFSDSIVLDTAALTTTIWTWGANQYGQLGDGKTEDRSTAFQLYGIDGFDAIAASMNKSVALKSDGTIWAWGNGNTRVPQQLAGIDDVISIKNGSSFSIALKADGTVWTWGSNYYGQLGDGTTTDRLTPVQTVGLSDVIAIAGGGSHSLALKSDGTVWSWGYNYMGQLGDGTTTNRLTPVQVIGLSEVVAIETGSYHSIALKSGGTVWTFGSNSSGQLGDGTTTNRLTPVQMIGMQDIIDVTGGVAHTAALGEDGRVWACGRNYYGQVGDGTTTSRLIPVIVTGLSNVIDIDSGDYHTLALKSDGTVWAWGYNNRGQLGDRTTVNRVTPVQVYGILRAIAIAGGDFHSVVLTTDSLPAVIINLGDSFTNSQAVTLNLICPNVGGDCVQMQFSNDGSVWSTPEVFSASREWTSTAGDGTKTVYARFQDSGENWSTLHSDSIVLDATPPVVTVYPASGTYYGTIYISPSCSDTIGSGCSKIYYSLTGRYYYEFSSLSLSSNATVWFYAVDKAGNPGAVTSVSYMIPDVWPPIGSISINGGGVSTITAAVTLSLYASDTNPDQVCALVVGLMCGVTEMKFSNDGVSWTTPEPARTSKSWTLLPGNGTKTVYVQFKDNAGNWSGPISDSIILNIITPPDLIVYSLAVPATGSAGSTINVTDTTKNKAIGDASVSVTSFYLSANPALDAGDTLLGSRSVPALGAGLSDTGVTSLTLPSGLATGTYYLIAKADGPNAITETIETNNTRSGIIRIGPDLIMASLAIPGIGGAGSTINVTDTTKNNAIGDAPASVTSFYLSANTALDAGDTLLGSRAVPALAASASSTSVTTLTIPAGTSTGRYYIIARADGPGAIAEAYETNNTRAGIINVGPDLTNVYLSTSGIPRSGGIITVTNTIKNIGGDAAVISSTTSYFLSSNTTLDSGDVFLGSRPVNPLSSGQGDVGSAIPVTIPAETVPGTYYLIAKADADDLIAETNEANNTYARAIVVQ